MSAAGKINQKEYLKKYLSGDVSGQTKKKKKKKEKLPSKATVTIVDDDIDLSQLANATEEDLENYNLGEDLPQIAGIVDERSADVIAKEDYKTSTKWKTLGGDATADAVKQTTKKYSCDSSPPRRPNRVQRSPDASPPRRNKGRDASPPRRKRSPDLSPPRRKRSADASPPRRQQSKRDASPPRRRRSRDASPPRRKRSPDLSSPRRKRSSDASPPRRQQSNRDSSPPRQRRSRDASPPRRKRSPDLSPPRRKRSSSDASPPRRNRNRSPDSSPKRVKRNRHSPSVTPPKRMKHSTDSSPPRRANAKMTATLEGKRAGLQDAVALREENDQIRRREDEMFRKMAEKQNHDESNTVRDRKTGRRAKFHRDSEKDAEQMKRDAERKEVYDRWGAGLKQIEEYKQRVAIESHEMSKPVARYADDNDLEDYLRNQCRDGDPMAKYMQKKSAENQTGPRKPIYQGSCPENRFNIRPGYRWDGVDRSNGYEKKWFDQQNQKKAVEEEAYKYSVEDM